MHPYFWSQLPPWQTLNPADIPFAQRPYAWDPTAYQTAYSGMFPGLAVNPYYAGNFPRSVFPMAPVTIAPEVTRGVPQAGFPGFGGSEYLSPETFISGFSKTTGNYLTPEFLEFLRAELLRCGKALRTVATGLEHEHEEVKQQAHLAATAQFFYALGLLYTRGLIIPPEVPGTTSRAEEPSPATACEVFGEALERFAREQFLGRGVGRELGELSEKARACFRALAPEGEQLERVRDERIKVERKKAVNV
jgi:hypothetical protein